jgi:acetyl esterase/lipase
LLPAQGYHIVAQSFALSSSVPVDIHRFPPEGQCENSNKGKMTSMTNLDRRAFLALGGALILADASAEERGPSKLTPPAPARALPKSWLSAPKIAVWPQEPPGAAGFRGEPAAPSAAPIFLQNISSPDLRVFRPSRPNGHALLVMPGGAYRFVSVVNEGVEVASWMNRRGVTVFVLTYRLPGEGWERRADVPLQDAQRAMRVIRSKASAFGIDADKVSVLGYSAGGHLAATLATQHAEASYVAKDEADRLSARPFAAGLIYPVVTMATQWTHAMSRTALLGEAPSDAEVMRRSAELHVGAATPPVFAVHAMDDPAVPVENTLQFVNAMRNAKRPVEAHLLQEGGHAFGVGYPDTPSALWPRLFDLWLKRLA